ncbi:MAG TPA: CsbD family protein [Pseudonocardiaceae bacterium]|nr:CsbD family protein [Pseudonocardiaceae bacterium]
MQDKITDRAQVLAGRAKEAAGKITDNPLLEVEGKLDQGKGNFKQTGEKVRDAGNSVFGR